MEATAETVVVVVNTCKEGDIEFGKEEDVPKPGVELGIVATIAQRINHLATTI